MTTWEELLLEMLETVKSKGKYSEAAVTLQNLARNYNHPGFDWEKWAEENSLETSSIEIWKNGKPFIYSQFFRRR